MTFQDDINRMLASAYADLDPPMLGEAFGGPRVTPAPDGQQIRLHMHRGFIQASPELLFYAGAISEEEAITAGWTPPPPPSWRSRFRWRWQAWRERAGRTIGGWLAGVDLSERDED